MANVIRLNNGGVIQVRTGVLQGIGPIGPTGLRGPQGQQGEQGAQGETGPMGAIAQYMSKTKVGGPQTVGPDQDTLVTFGAVQYDDMSAFTNSTTVTIPEAGDYVLNAYLQFELPTNAGDGLRAAWFVSSVEGVLARTQLTGVVDDKSHITINWPHRAAAGETIKVYARNGDDLAIALSGGSLVVNRIGAGARGVAGPQGPAGAVGATGAQGIQGPAGNSGAGYATYAALHV